MSGRAVANARRCVIIDVQPAAARQPDEMHAASAAIAERTEELGKARAKRRRSGGALSNRRVCRRHAAAAVCTLPYVVGFLLATSKHSREFVARTAHPDTAVVRVFSFCPALAELVSPHNTRGVSGIEISETLTRKISAVLDSCSTRMQ